MTDYAKEGLVIGDRTRILCKWGSIDSNRIIFGKSNMAALEPYSIRFQIIPTKDYGTRVFNITTLEDGFCWDGEGGNFDYILIGILKNKCMWIDNYIDTPKKMTQYERIKSLSLEEMAEEFTVFIPSIRYKDEPEYHYFGARPAGRYLDSAEAVKDGIDWLKSEVEEEKC